MSSSAASVDNWTDSEIRTKLAELGTPVGPVTETTRKILIKKLKRLLQLQNNNASPSKRGSLARYSSGEETQDDSNMPPPTAKMRNRRKTTGSAELKTALADSSVNSGLSDANKKDRLYKERKSFANVTVRSKIYETDSDSDIVEVPQVRKSKRYAPASDMSPKLSISTSQHTIDQKKSWREGTPEARLSSYENKLSPNRSRHSPDAFGDEEEEDQEEEEVEDEELEQEEERPAYQSDLLKRLTTGGRFSSSYASTDSPKPENYRSSLYSSVSTSYKPSSAYKPYSSMHEPLNSFSSVDRSKYVFTADKYQTSSSSTSSTKSSISLLSSLHKYKSKIIYGSVVLVIFLALLFLFSAFNTRVYLAALDSDENIYPVCGQPGMGSVCVEQKDLQAALDISKVFIPWVVSLTTKAYCESGAGDFVDKPTITEDDAIKYLSSKMPSRHGSMEKDIRNFKLLVLKNPHWEVEVTSNGLSDINAILFNGNFAARSVDLPVGCYLRLTAFNALKTLVYTLVFVGIGVLLVLGFRYFKFRQEQHKKDVYKMVNKILTLLCARHEQNILPGYVAVNNCRDELIQPIERDAKKKVWQDAVEFIEKHESRVRSEMHSVRGENVKVWRWLPAGGPPMSPGSSPENSGPVLGRLL